MAFMCKLKASFSVECQPSMPGSLHVSSTARTGKLNECGCAEYSSHLIVLVCVVPPKQMLLYKQFLNHSVVNGWDGLLEVLIKRLLCVRHSWWIPDCTIHPSQSYVPELETA